MPRQLPDTLHTARLRLREPRSADALLIFKAYAQDADVARFLLWRPHSTLLETQAFIAQCMDDWSAGYRQCYVLTLREVPAQPIGMLDARFRGHLIDIGYVLARPYWGHGLMPEALSRVSEAALALPAVFRLQATCDFENHASARTLEKAGFLREGRLERHSALPNIGTEPRACLMYARCK